MKTGNENHRSRVLAYILRHDKKSPIKHGGWISVDYLISEKEFSYEELVNIVLSDEKMRFEFNDDHTLIRALYGHSVPVDLGLMCKVPPSAIISWNIYKCLSRHIRFWTSTYVATLCPPLR